MTKELTSNYSQNNTQRTDPLDLLFERAADLADRTISGNLRFIEAVDMAYSAADWSGLVDRYGDDVVQLVLADAFGSRP